MNTKRPSLLPCGMNHREKKKKTTLMNQQNLQTDSRVKHRLLLSHGIKWGLIHFPPCVSLPSDRTFCCAMLMFSALWQDAICHSNELLCGRKKKRSQGTFLKMSGSRECKVCNTVNSSGPALQARGLLVNQFLNRSNSCQIKAGNREFRNQSRILCWKAGFSSFGKI